MVRCDRYPSRVMKRNVPNGGGTLYLCLCSEIAAGQESVSYVPFDDERPLLLGRAAHGRRGEGGVGLGRAERGGSWLVHALTHAETSPIPARK